MTQSALPDINSWSVEQIRFTSFVIPSVEINSPMWWDAVVGEPPDNASDQPKRGVTTRQGALGDGKLIFGTQPSRIDWTYGALDSQNPEIPSFGAFPKARDEFANLIQKWLKLNIPSLRLAFGIVLHLPMDSREEGYSKLTNFLSNLQLSLSNASDFMYQINRPRSSKTISDLWLNRLSRWSVVSIRTAQVRLMPVDIVKEVEKFAIRLELDINTDQHRKADIPNDKQSSIFEELMELGNEIIKNGDIP